MRRAPVDEPVPDPCPVEPARAHVSFGDARVAQGAHDGKIVNTQTRRSLEDARVHAAARAKLLTIESQVVVVGGEAERDLVLPSGAMVESG